MGDMDPGRVVALRGRGETRGGIGRGFAVAGSYEDILVLLCYTVSRSDLENRDRGDRGERAYAKEVGRRTERDEGREGSK